MSRTTVILRKELREIAQNKSLIATMAALPLTFAVVPTLAAWSLRDLGAQLVGVYLSHYAALPAGLPPKAALLFMVAKNFLPMFLVMPLFIPVLVTSQSVVGEKERRTLEPLLATPATPREIVLGKSLAAVVPALLLTWLAFVVFAAGVDLLAWPLFHRLLLPDSLWLFSVFVLSPLLAFFGTTLTVLVSSRVTDARLAQNFAALVVIPFVGIVVVQAVGFFFLGPLFYAALAAGVVVADFVLLRVAVFLFDSEWVLTRWR